MASRSEPPLSSHVLSYFVRNPRAVDSLEGVARWRLLEEAIQRRVNATQDALEWLVERGVLRREQGPGLEPVFSLDPDKKEEAERLLAELTERGDLR